MNEKIRTGTRKIIRVSKQEIVNDLLSLADPAVTDPGDIASVIFDLHSQFVTVILNPSVLDSVETIIDHGFTKKAFVEEILINHDASISESDIESIEIDPSDSTKVKVSLKRKQVESV